jgi:hypothetical protein
MTSRRRGTEEGRKKGKEDKKNGKEKIRGKVKKNRKGGTTVGR